MLVYGNRKSKQLINHVAQWSLKELSMSSASTNCFFSLIVTLCFQALGSSLMVSETVRSNFEKTNGSNKLLTVACCVQSYLWFLSRLQDIQSNVDWLWYWSLAPPCYPFFPNQSLFMKKGEDDQLSARFPLGPFPSCGAFFRLKAARITSSCCLSTQ